MRKSILLSFLVIGICIWAVVTVDILVFQSDTSSIKHKAASHPEIELTKSDLGRQLLSVFERTKTDPQESSSQLEALKLTSSSKLTPTEKAYWLKIQINLSKNQKDNRTEEALTLRLKNLADKEGMTWLTVSLLIDEAVSHARHSRIPQAEILITQAITLAEDNHILYPLPRAYNAAGFISNSLNELLKSQRYFSQGIKVATEIEDDFYNSTIHNNLGLLYLHIERWQKALEYMKKARHLLNESGVINDPLMHTIYLNEAFIYNRLGDVENSIAAYSESQLYFDKEKASARDNLIQLKGKSEVLLLLEQYEESQKTAEQCLNFPASKEYPLEFGQCYLLLAKSLNQLKEHQLALNMVDEAIAVFTEIDHERWVTSSYKQKAEVYSSLGDSESALEMYRIFYKQDKQQLLGKVYNLENAFATRRIEQERDLLDVEKKLTEAKLAKERLRFQVACIWGIIAIVIITLTIQKTVLIHRKNKELEDLTFIDPLTGLNNRRYYYHQVKAGKVLSKSLFYRIALLDLDYFKQVNDQHGHDVGDEVLKESATRVRSLLAKNELFIRWGGEEFLVVLIDDDSVEKRIQVILEAFNQTKFETSAGKLDITTSIGVSHPALPIELDLNDEYFRKADQNLYEAKRSGRNQAVYSES
ncbi:tetratricopeptide repeat-containing diguanylate cyclase [Vibrio sp. 99-70-13A1]|uniref:tetratricopeptide repeat-containing diguanylate cyclase n=1 Tax=Vibrio sp. 99-70-13A1 TaxID=2607601 RepID=UPI001493BB84|nr:tetratricopeptide repeat-containing diguanylate cyclase [Vibrio sp. 99-70-13A1]NOH95602.1 diguanylate cyclase [Vibrio sp. 99-70-13A1]